MQTAHAKFINAGTDFNFQLVDFFRHYRRPQAVKIKPGVLDYFEHIAQLLRTVRNEIRGVVLQDQIGG